jgi:hypothetical protein
VGGNRAVRKSRAQLRWATVLVGIAAMSIAATACNDDEPSATGDVGAAGAYTAIVEWQAGEQEPVLNDDGEEQLPVIYVVAADGETIDVGVQANVAAATVDIADVRFADESAEAFDDGADGEPVIDDGVMLFIGVMPDPAPTVDVDLLRFLNVETSSPYNLQITLDDADTNSGGVGVATVTSVTQP